MTTQPKERPILFSGPMVRAILNGTKTQTRRVVKPQPEKRDDGWHVATKPRSGYSSERTMRDILPVYCPYGQPGDRLWVRETWGYAFIDECQHPVYRADMPNTRNFLGWKPSIHMPRKLSRITLEITDVKVERLQDIREMDAYKEGCELPPDKPRNHRRSFAALWDSINERRGFSWASNPWVWAITFKVVPL